MELDSAAEGVSSLDPFGPDPEAAVAHPDVGMALDHFRRWTRTGWDTRADIVGIGIGLRAAVFASLARAGDERRPPGWAD